MDEEMEFVKHFCRIITQAELTDSEVIEFFDVVQSVVSTKMVTGYSAASADTLSVDVIAYVIQQDQNVYEILLNEPIDVNEGDEISSLLVEEFSDIDFDFEASLEQ